MKKFDPYDVLGVAPDAGADEIKAAARASYKRTHPDAGGDVDKFQRTRRAELVLLDPVRRKCFDETGDAGDDNPDNDRAAALQIIESFLGPLINDFLGSGMQVVKDPRRFDIFALFAKKMAADIADIENSIPKAELAVEFFQDMAARLECRDPGRWLERSFERQIDNAKNNIKNAKHAIEMRRLALEIASTYSFRSDPFLGVQVGFPPTTTATVTTGSATCQGSR